MSKDNLEAEVDLVEVNESTPEDDSTMVDHSPSHLNNHGIHANIPRTNFMVRKKNHMYL